MNDIPVETFIFDDFKNYLYEQLIQRYSDYGIQQMNDPTLQAMAVIDIRELARLAKKRGDALMVIIKTPVTFDWLKVTDPKALEQCLEAVGAEIVSDTK